MLETYIHLSGNRSLLKQIYFTLKKNASLVLKKSQSNHFDLLRHDARIQCRKEEPVFLKNAGKKAAVLIQRFENNDREELEDAPYAQ